MFFERPRTLRWGRHGEEILTHTLGVLRVTLRPTGYDWAFIPVHATTAPPPSGSGRCHDNPPAWTE